MGQEFVIKSTTLEDKVNQLLPSQGGAQAGVDLSASSMIVPVVNLTEAAEGSTLREDLQTAFSHDVTTNTNINNASNTVIVNTTGYYRVFGTFFIVNASGLIEINLFDGTTSKTLIKFINNLAAGAAAAGVGRSFDFIVCLEAGDSLRGTSASGGADDFLNVSSRQLADLSGNLINPA